MKVQGGRVLRKNNHALARGDYLLRAQDEIRIDRRGPGPGFRHLLTVADLRAFLALLPEWDELAIGLDAVVLDAGGDGMGWHRYGVVAVCAWERELWWTDAEAGWVDEHDAVLARLGVERVRSAGRIELRWSEPQARAFQLLHVLTHELGHHHDRMTTRTRWWGGRGEPYAEAYAHRVADALWPAYEERFGLL